MPGADDLVPVVFTGQAVLDEDDEFIEAQPWDRMPGESILWYDRFCRYLQLGIERKLATIWRQDRHLNKSRAGQTQLPTSGHAQYVLPQSWREQIEHYHWRERAIAYDEYQIVTARQVFESEKLKERKRRINLLKSYRIKLRQAIKTLNVKDINWREAVAGLKIVTEQLRMEYGDMPTQRVEYTGAGGGPIAVEHSLSTLSDEELDAKIANYLESTSIQVGVREITRGEGTS